MGKVLDAWTEELREWVVAQRLFFVATAPLSREGHINCSPKGGDCFRLLDDDTAAYVDLTGSGIETIAHIQENGRIVLMFCAMVGPPRIVRIHGLGEVVYPSHADFSRLVEAFDSPVGARAIIRVKIERLSTSCGYSVPIYDFVGQRDTLDRWAQKKGPEGLCTYRQCKNRKSIDGLPGYRES